MPRGRPITDFRVEWNPEMQQKMEVAATQILNIGLTRLTKEELVSEAWWYICRRGDIGWRHIKTAMLQSISRDNKKLPQKPVSERFEQAFGIKLDYETVLLRYNKQDQAILRLWSQGYNNREIAERVGKCYEWVRSKLNNLLLSAKNHG